MTDPLPRAIEDKVRDSFARQTMMTTFGEGRVASLSSLAATAPW